MKTIILFLAAVALTAGAQTHAAAGPEYDAMKRNLARGWNTWDTRSVLTHALMPEGFALKLKIRKGETGKVLEQALIGRRGEQDEKIRPGLHAYDGSFTELTLLWQGINVRVESATIGDDLVMLVSPEAGMKPGTLIVEPEMIFGRKGTLTAENGALKAELPSKTITVYFDGTAAPAPDASNPTRFEFSLDSSVGISTNAKRSKEDIKNIINKARGRLEQDGDKYGSLHDLHDAMQSVLAWNVIYEPTKDRVITPVSRAWSIGWGGYVLFDWDTYFASYMLSLDSRELAYANAIEITKESTDSGFVPNYAGANSKSLDRSQPPVGSFVVREIYRKYRDKWFLAEVFDYLLTWNRWWVKNRVTNGLLCWGSNPYKGFYSNPGELANVNQRMGAALESGLDNSPMYDDIPFNGHTHQLKLADAGLTAMYVMDCDALADIADELGKTAESKELRARAETYRQNLGALWSEKDGIYLNKRTDTGAFSERKSPTNFYPLLARAPSPQQAGRMMKEHFYNPAEFWGDWIIPSISRDDPEFPDNEYWRGRIWAPMNFLVYLGLRNYDLPDARRDLAAKSAKLLLKSWLDEGHVYENYNSMTGTGSDVGSSDMFYHWGALLGFISFFENDFVAPPEKSLK